MKTFNELAKEVAEKEGGDLRFEAKFLPVAEVATQYYCEKKVEMGQIYGRVETPKMKIGKDAHELLLKDTVKAKLEQVLQEIYSGKPVLIREMFLLGKHKDIIIIGVADAVLFLKRYPIFLFEYKFSDKPMPFRDHHVQAKLYCYLLSLMGWDTSRLRYVLVMASPELIDSVELRKVPLEVVKNPKRDKLKVKIDGKEASIYINPFKIEEAISELDWAIGFWKNERTAIPTRRQAKCEVCEFKKVCDSRLSASNSRS